MSNKIKAPNQKSNSFLWAIGILIVVIIAIIAFVVGNLKKENAKATQEALTNVGFNIAVDGSAVQLKADSATDSTPVVDLYDDLSCPHCADLEKATGASMLDAVDQGKLVVNVRTMNFLDRGNTDGHSSRGLTALWAIAQSGDAKLYWNYRTGLFEKQSTIYGQWNYSDFADYAKQLGASDTVVNNIKNSSDHDAALAAATGNEDYLKSQDPQQQVSSPRVFVNGKELKLEATSSHDFKDWVPQAETGSVA